MPTTTSYNRGAVVLLPFPFSDQSSAKIRPAVVANPRYPSDDLLVVAVTSVGDHEISAGNHGCISPANPFQVKRVDAFGNMGFALRLLVYKTLAWKSNSLAPAISE